MLASLERAVGVQLNEHPPDPSALATPPGSGTPRRPSVPNPPASGSPFRPDGRSSRPAPEGDPAGARDGNPAPLVAKDPGPAADPAR
jgi:hypothetical protein